METNTPASEFRHFDSLVPENVMREVHELAEAAKNDFISDVSADALGAANISPIFGYSLPGYTPFQDGGYEVSELYSSDTDSSYHLTKAQTEAMNERQDDCYESFAHDYAEKLKPYFDAQTEKLDYSIIEAAGLDSKFSDYESECFAPALLRLKLWVESNKYNVHVMLGFNYLDQPYYRSHFDETLFEFTLTTKQALRMSGERFVKKLKRALEAREIV